MWRYWLFPLLLIMAGCTTKIERKPLPEGLPETIDFLHQSFHFVHQVTLDDMVRYIYQTKDIHAKHKRDQQLVIFVQQRQPNLTLSERLKLRKEYHDHNPLSVARVELKNEQLLTRALYYPSERYPHWGIEVNQGTNLDCGFVEQQYQYSIDRDVFKQLSETEIINQLQVILLEQQNLLQMLPQLDNCPE